MPDESVRKQESKICQECDKEFFRKEGDSRWRLRLYCCKGCQTRAARGRFVATASGRVRLTEYQMKYLYSEKGRAKRVEYLASEAGKAMQAKSEARYRASEKGKAKKADYLARYWASDKGRAKHAAHQAKYQASGKGKLCFQQWQGDPNGFIEYHKNRYRMLYVEKLPCVRCGETNVLKLQTDHVLARGLGGTHERTNLQVLCKVCHRLKTTSDLREIRSAHNYVSLEITQ